jgi:hypothetical protein
VSGGKVTSIIKIAISILTFKLHLNDCYAKTPYQRLLEAGILAEAKQRELATTYHGLNPVLLLKQIDENLECLWRLAERPIHQQEKAKTYAVMKTFAVL